MMLLLIALLFTGCAGNTLPDEDTEKTEQSADSEAREEVKEEYSAEESDDKKYQESTAEKYYTSINRKMLKFTQADPNSSFMQEYEGFEADEVVLFEVIIENNEAKRYITIGSKDGWNNCSILNEGY